jgi:hypothetical protein
MAAFKLDEGYSYPHSSHFDYGIYELNQLISKFGGNSYQNGLYRVIGRDDLDAWNHKVSIVFPEYKKEQIFCFGFDWLGRVFALDRNANRDDDNNIIMFELGTGQVLEIPANLKTFHNNEIIGYGDASLASGFYKLWMISGGQPPNYGQCIGYKKPLFLGGADNLDNLELSEIDVYWTIVGQLILKIRGQI